MNEEKTAAGTGDAPVTAKPKAVGAEKSRVGQEAPAEAGQSVVKRSAMSASAAVRGSQGVRPRRHNRPPPKKVRSGCVVVAGLRRVDVLMVKMRVLKGVWVQILLEADEWFGLIL